MATFYLDYEGGNDANDGLSFANRWKTFTNGATAARIAPGDTIRVMASPDPTSLGVTGVWTSAQLQATKTISSSTNATPIAVTSTAHGYSTGDTVVITGHSTNTNANGTWEITVTGADTFTLNNSVGNGIGGATGSVRLRNNTRIKLASSLTQNIECTGEFTNWTGVTNVTPTLNTTTFKEHRASQQIAIAAGFATGLACYKALPSTLDLSGYQQVSFWIMQTAGTLATAGAITLRLCSDSAGVTTVNTITLPAIPVLNTWIPITIDTGAALGSSINSIAFYVATDLGAQTFLLDNIIACKASSSADSLSLPSLIGKNTAGEQWWPIQSINGTRVMLDYISSAPNSASTRGYYGTSETVTTYKREAISTLNHNLGTQFALLNDNGAVGNLLNFSGGWNRSDMSTQTGETWYDICNNGSGIAVPSNIGFGSYISLTKFGIVRASDVGINLSSVGSGGYIVDVAVTACGSSGFRFGSNPISNNVSMTVRVNSSATGISLGSGLNYNRDRAVGVTFAQPFHLVGCGTGFAHSVQNGYYCSDNIFSDLVIQNCATGFVTSRSLYTTLLGAQLLGCDQPISWSGIDDFNAVGYTFNNCTIDTRIAIGSPEKVRFINGTYESIFGSFNSGTINDSIPAYTWVSNINATNIVLTGATEIGRQAIRSNCRFNSHNHDNTAGNHKIFTDGGLISAATDQRHTASGISWKLQPTSTNRSSTYPLDLSLAKVAVAANSLVTVKAWMRRDNTGLTMRLVCKGGQIAGVSSDVVASMSAAANTWQELTITFTPTEAGVVEITAEAYGGSTYSGWVDDMTITQA